ncbi:MAG: ATP-binding protein [Georgfuchsia sp.]
MPPGSGSRTTDTIAKTCGAFVAILGLIALAGWTLDLPVLTSLGPGWIPMAPSTALLFILFGFTVFIVARTPPNRTASRIGITIGSAGVLIALLLLIMSSLGVLLKVEHLGFAISGTVGGSPIGHMSPVTALCFLVGGLSMVAVDLSSPARRWPAIAGSWLAGCLVVANSVFVLAYLFGMPLLYWGPLIPPALTTCVALAMLGSALLALARARILEPEQQAYTAPRISRFYVAIFTLLAMCLVTAGTIYSRSLLAQRRAEADQMLSAVADLKVSQLVNWRAERLGDAALLHRNAIFANLVRQAFGVSRNAQLRDQLNNFLRQLQDAHGYHQVFLFDALGVARISLPEAPPTAFELEAARRTLLSGEISLEYFHRDEPGGAPHLSLLVPILDDAAGGRPVAVVILLIDPSRYLYPMIERWPTPSATAETLLVRRDGNDVLFLNELRFQKHTALSLRFPLTRTDLPAAKAVLGQEGIVEGTDYRGDPTMAAVRRVPDTPWFLVARVSTQELFEATFNSLGLAVGVVAMLLISAAMVLGNMWRQQRVIYYKERAKVAELEVMAQKLARSNLELEQFAYVASHDLQEPLRMVVGFVQLLEKRLVDKLDAETREFMGFAVDGALRMQNLIQDILAYSRVTTRGLPLEPVDSAAALKEALDRLASRIAETDTKVEAQSLPIVMADRAQLVQLFQNLISNAIKFCKGHAPRVCVQAMHEAGWWRFSVTDNGIGIAPEYRGHLFVIFKRLHTRREYPGTGIGLAICKRIIERHGGEIGIESVPDGGSVFWFTLPEEKSK